MERDLLADGRDPRQQGLKQSIADITERGAWLPMGEIHDNKD